MISVLRTFVKTLALALSGLLVTQSYAFSATPTSQDVVVSRVVVPVPQSVYRQSRTPVSDVSTQPEGARGASASVRAASLRNLLSDTQAVRARLNRLDTSTRAAVLSALRSISEQSPPSLSDRHMLLANEKGAGASVDATPPQTVLSDARILSARLNQLDPTTRNTVLTALQSLSGQSRTSVPNSPMPPAREQQTDASVNVASLQNLLSSEQTDIAGMKSQGMPVSDATPTEQQSLDGQSQTLLPDARLLLVGGESSGSPVNGVFVQNARLASRTEAFGALLHARAFHSATLLPSGSVLIFGGVANGSSTLAQAELFDPAKESSADILTPGLTARAHHTATLLTDGRVLIAGGLDGQGKSLSQIELWNYRTGQGTTLEVSLKTPRSGHKATLLADGTVLLWGGQDENSSPLNYGEIIDPNGPSVRFVGRLTETLQGTGLPRLAASIPQSGETGIPIDQLISLRFSKPLATTSLSSNTISLRTSSETVAIQVVPAEDGKLAFITPQNHLQNGTAYTLSISGATDTAGQILPDTTVLFTTVEGTANVAVGGQDNSTDTGSTGLAGVGAAASTSTGLNSEWRKLPMLQSNEGVTALAGQVLTLDGSPLPNVLIEIDSQQATTDKTGRFLVQNTGSGHHMMIVDGAPANTKSASYGLYRIGVDLKASVTNSLNYTVWMTALDTAHVVKISSPTKAEVVVTNPNVPGLEIHIPAGTTIHDARGNVVTEVGITAISTTQPPFPIKKGVVFPVYFTIQPGGATFSGTTTTWSAEGTRRRKGATIHYRNYMNAKPGARYQFWNYDPTQRGWYTYGNGRVSADSKKIVPEDATQIFAFDAASAGTCGATCPPPNPPKPCNPLANDPVDVQTGLFLYCKTDLEIKDVIPLTVTRTYRQGDSVVRDFGIGMTTDYDIFLTGDDSSNPEGFTYQDLILADGGQIHFTRTSPCTGTNGFCQEGGTYTATSTPSDYYGATLQLVSSGGYKWELTKKDGTVYLFGAPWLAGDLPRLYALVGMHDRSGNALTFTRDGNSNLTRITSPNGRWIQFTYDSTNRITSAQDNIGRTTSYTYDPLSGCLATATDANGGVTTYTYNAQGDMLSIKNPNGIVYLQNQYDENDRVNLQTLANTPAGIGTFQFAYTTDANGNVAQTTVTDPRGYKRTITFNSDGYTASDVQAAGALEQQTSTYNRQQGTGFLLSSTDALNNATSYSYDAMGNITSITQLAGTLNATTSSMAYDLQFNRLISITDSLGNTITVTMDHNGNMMTSTDPLGNTTMYTYNSAGQRTSVTEPLGNQTQFIYDSGDLVATIDPLGRITTFFVDGAGSEVATTDPLGHTTRKVYNPLDKVIDQIDPLGNHTSFVYDENGNLLSATDANQHTVKYTYDSMDHEVTRTDPLQHQASSQYDLVGNLTKTTDRKGQVTTYAYDGLSRMTFAGYGTQAGPTYQSTTSYTYDAGNRLTRITDSITGTIERSFDGLGNLLSETTPHGSVVYTYDADGRKSTMTSPSQAVVTYTYNNASRLTSIVQGTSMISFGYDSNARRNSITLPNGVIGTYSYDAASQLEEINYQSSTLASANLTYYYDLAGRRIRVGGSLASTQLPAEVSSAIYDANNRLTQWGSAAMTYDANGSTLSDGMNSYEWDARNRLVSADNNGAAFAYDPLGRRVSKTIISTTTNYLYDGLNAIAELSGAETVSLLTGGVDERFTRTDLGGTSSYLTDALGSTVALTDATGASQTQYSYTPYGAQSATGAISGNSYTYTGRETDGLGINYYRARYYNPTIGRYLSEDPSGTSSGLNLYEYVQDDPIDLYDPTGLSSKVPANSQFYICCQKGQVKICDHGGSSNFDGWILDCMQQHEKQHVKDLTHCGKNPCKGQSDAPLLTNNSKALECAAYTVQLECMKTAPKSATIDSMRKQIQQHVTENCGGKQ